MESGKNTGGKDFEDAGFAQAGGGQQRAFIEQITQSNWLDR